MISNNLPLIQSPKEPAKREKFIKAVLNGVEFENAVNKYCAIPLSERVFTKIKLTIKKWRK